MTVRSLREGQARPNIPEKEQGELLSLLSGLIAEQGREQIQAITITLSTLLDEPHLAALCPTIADMLTTFASWCAARHDEVTEGGSRTKVLIEGRRQGRSIAGDILTLAAALIKPQKLSQEQKVLGRQAIAHQMDALVPILIAPRRVISSGPVDIQTHRRAAMLREYGYAQLKDGLYSVREDSDGEEQYSLVCSFHVDIEKKRHIYTVPDRLSESPKEQGVVLLAKFKRLLGRRAEQKLEIHRSDMLAKQPKFFEQIQAVKPPHKRKHADFLDALESLADMAEVESRYNATGLVQTEDGLVFLHPAGGALTEQGIQAKYQVQFPFSIAPRLTALPYGWQRPSAPDEQKADFLTLLKMLDIAPGASGYGDVLLGLHAFTPFSQACDTGGVWAIVHGLTGSLKSATSRLPLQGYARCSGREETSTVNMRDLKSTEYAIEQTLYYLSGLFAHCDDGLKGNNIAEKDIKKFYGMLSTFGGHSVTKQGGKRGIWGQGEGGFGVEPYPRGSGVYTVESLPSSESYASDIARYIVVSLDGVERVDVDLLTQLQLDTSAAAMNRITAAYIAWLLPRMPGYLAGIAEKEESYRAHQLHARTPTSFAKLEIGIAALLDFGVSLGAISAYDAEQLLSNCHEHLIDVALQQAEIMGMDEQKATANDATNVFYKLFHTALRSHQLYATDSAHRAIEDFSSDGGSRKIIGYRPQPPCFLTDIEEDTTGSRPAEKPDLYGWRWNENQRVYEPGGQEAGVLKWDEGTPVEMHMYVRDFKEIVYPTLVRLAAKEEVPLPGSAELLSKLREKGRIRSTNPTNLHGRNSQNARCYVLDMTPEPDKETPQEKLDRLLVPIGNGLYDLNIDEYEKA